MSGTQAVAMFQDVLDGVARTGERREVEAGQVPDRETWQQLDSRGCVIWVNKGRWWVLPPAGTEERPAA
ncbi:MAG: hypothetical protein AB1578_10350 [Thermodesulfobacteriota bacterium]